MIELGEQLRFAAEARDALRVAREVFRENFERHFAVELVIAGAVNVAHTARTDGGRGFRSGSARCLVAAPCSPPASQSEPRALASGHVFSAKVPAPSRSRL